MSRTKRSLIAFMVIVLSATALWALNRAPAGRARQGRIDDLLASMTLEEKVGQMVMAGFPGYEAAAEANTLVSRHYLGGVMLSTRNIRDPRQTANLTAQLQRLAMQHGAGVPLFIAVDQEGGYIVRLRGPVRFPGNMALGATRSPELTQRVAKALGTELRSVGINMNFAPVVDVNSNPANPVIGVRSFGESPALVAQLGAAFVAGLHDAGICATAKHFPGHGDTAQDSHIALPSVKHPRSHLETVELAPFRQVISAQVDAIMTAHVTFPAIEPTPGVPATLSHHVLTGLLREDMDFDGVIITDAMEMKAIVDNFGLAEASVRAVQAGTDIVLIAWPNDWRQAVRVPEALIEAVKEGRISESRVDASVKRILHMKERYNLWENTKAHPLTRDEEKEIAAAGQTAAEQAVSLVRDLKNRLPLGAKSGKVLVIAPSVGAITGAEDADAPRVHLATALRRYLDAVDEVSIPSKPDAAVRHKIVAQAAHYDTVIMATYSAWSKPYQGQADLVEALRGAGHEPIVIALREPYDLARFPHIGTYLATYSANPESLRAVVEVLVGKTSPTGRLPVSIPGLYSMTQ